MFTLDQNWRTRSAVSGFLAGAFLVGLVMGLIGFRILLTIQLFLGGLALVGAFVGPRNQDRAFWRSSLLAGATYTFLVFAPGIRDEIGEQTLVTVCASKYRLGGDLLWRVGSQKGLWSKERFFEYDRDAYLRIALRQEYEQSRAGAAVTTRCAAFHFALSWGLAWLGGWFGRLVNRHAVSEGTDAPTLRIPSALLACSLVFACLSVIAVRLVPSDITQSALVTLGVIGMIALAIAAMESSEKDRPLWLFASASAVVYLSIVLYPTHYATGGFIGAAFLPENFVHWLEGATATSQRARVVAEFGRGVAEELTAYDAYPRPHWLVHWPLSWGMATCGSAIAYFLMRMKQHRAKVLAMDGMATSGEPLTQFSLRDLMIFTLFASVALATYKSGTIEGTILIFHVYFGMYVLAKAILSEGATQAFWRGTFTFGAIHSFCTFAPWFWDELGKQMVLGRLFLLANEADRWRPEYVRLFEGTTRANTVASFVGLTWLFALLFGVWCRFVYSKRRVLRALHPAIWGGICICLAIVLFTLLRRSWSNEWVNSANKTFAMIGLAAVLALASEGPRLWRSIPVFAFAFAITFLTIATYPIESLPNDGDPFSLPDRGPRPLIWTLTWVAGGIGALVGCLVLRWRLHGDPVHWNAFRRMTGPYIEADASTIMDHSSSNTDSK